MSALLSQRLSPWFKTWRIAEVKYLIKKIFFLIVHPVFGGGNDTVIAAACAHQQVLMQDILSKTIEQQIWRKVCWRNFWPTCHRNWYDSDFITNLRVDRGAFLLIFCWKTDPLEWEEEWGSPLMSMKELLWCYGVMAILNARSREHA